MKKHAFVLSLVSVGAASIAVQLVMVREFMASFSGNELTAGAALGIWLLGSGLGSLAGGRRANSIQAPLPHLVFGHLFLALYPIVMLFAVRALPFLWVRGELLGLSPFLAAGGLLLLPHAFMGGMMLPLCGKLITEKNVPVRVFLVDTAGDILGGLFFSLVFVHFLSHWQTVVVFGLMHIAAGAYLLYVRQKTALAVVAGAVAGVVLVASLGLSTLSQSFGFPGQTLLQYKNTPYSRLAITRSGRQLNVWSDRIWLFSSQDYGVEALVHPALCQAKKNPEVLLVAGGVFGSLHEIQKHKPERIDYIELDPAILKLDPLLLKSLTPGKDETPVETFITDGRLFIKGQKNAYDAILIDLPDPENAQLNRFYTREFFREAQNALKQNGVLGFRLTGAENYLSDQALAANQAVFQALKEVFPQVAVLPGPTHYFIAGSRPINLDLENLLFSRRIQTRQLSPYDLTSLTDPFRVNPLRDLLEEGQAKPNTDLSPFAFGHTLEAWMEKSQSPWALFYGVIALCFICCLWAWRGENTRFAVMSSGYAAMGIELALVFLFQVVFGYAYVALSFFVTLFLVGSGLGALFFFYGAMPPQRLALLGELGLVATAGLCLYLSPALVALKHPTLLMLVKTFALPGLILAAGFFAGAQFAAVSGLLKGSKSTVLGALYLADLAGGALGTLLLGLWLFPKLGILGVLASVVIVKGVSLILNWRLWRKPSLLPSR